MKLHFEPNLDYQHTAIESVCDLFRGQEINRTIGFAIIRVGDAMTIDEVLAAAASLVEARRPGGSV